MAAWASLSVQVWDKAFGRWRPQHPELTWRKSPLVHSSGTPPPSVALFGDDAGHRNLAELPDLLRSDLLPTLDMFDTPTRLASEYDVRRSFAFSCMEWAVHKGDVDAARLLLTRYLDAHPAARSRRDDARGAGLLRGSVCRRSRRRDARSGKKTRP